ncbi:MAG: helix-turn-helix domain-containing protein [Crocinitomicaceae bacterium]|nr:helix-turn-helix domain-containing protein [Crocinitomicaceae bacterium]
MQLKKNKANFRSQCSIACALDIIGDKWTLLIVRDALILGKSSFNEFRSSKEKIASNILQNRLEKLVGLGIMTKSANTEKKSKNDYFLTDFGLTLKPVIKSVGQWGYDSIEGVNNSAIYLK